MFSGSHKQKIILNSEAVPSATRWIYLECYCSWETLGWQLNPREEHCRAVFCFPLDIVPSIFLTTPCALPPIHWEIKLQDNIIIFLGPRLRKSCGFVFFFISEVELSAFVHILNLVLSGQVGRGIKIKRYFKLKYSHWRSELLAPMLASKVRSLLVLGKRSPLEEKGFLS